MGATDKTFVDGSVPDLEAADLNGYNLEQKNLIEDAEQVFDDTDREQQSKAVSNLVAKGAFRGDSGAADVYVLEPTGNQLRCTALMNGQSFIFQVGNTNTGASTVAVDGLTAKAIKNYLGNDVISGELTEDDYVLIIYDSANDYFVLLVNFTKQSNNIGDVRISTSNDAKFNEANCDGSAISRTTYAALFAKLSTTWGIGDGSTTFNIPDLRSATLRGVGTPTIFTSNDAVTLAQTIDDQIQGHYHLFGSNYHAASDNKIPDAGSTGTPFTGIGLGPSGANFVSIGNPYTDGSNGTPRTGTETSGKARGVYFFIRLF